MAKQPALKQSNSLRLLRCRSHTDHPFLLHHFSTEPNHQFSPEPAAKSDPSLIAQVLTLLKATDNDWTSNDKLRQLLFPSTTDSPSHSFSPLSFLRITRGLGSATKALQFFEYIRTNSPSPPDAIYLSSTFQAIFELASREHPNSPDKLHELFAAFKGHGLTMSINSATLLIRCFARAGMVEKSVLVYNEVDPQSRNTHVRNFMLDALLRSGLVDDAFRLLDEMLKPDSEFLPNGNTMDIVLAATMKRNWSGRSVSEEEVVELVSRFCERGVFPSALWLTQLITKLCRSGRTEKAWDLLHDVLKLGGHVEGNSCNALLTGLGRKHNFEKMNILLKEMKEKSIHPSVITFGILINHLCKFHRVDLALEVFEKMKGGAESDDVSVEPDVVIYNTLIDGLCKVGRQEEGLVLLEKMRTQNGCATNTVTYNCLIDGFCKAGEIERSFKLLEQMKAESVPANTITLNTFVDGMCRNGRINSAMELFNEMQSKNGIRGNAVTYTILINAFCNANNIYKAMELFDEMLEIGCTPDAYVYYTLIAGLCQAGKLDDACYVVSMLKDAGFCLDTVSCNILIGGFCRKNKLDKVYEMLKDMEGAGIKPDNVTYNTLVSYFSKTGDFTTAHRVMKNMINDRLEPTVVTYGALIHAYCKVKNLDEALKIFKDMSSSSRVSPNTVIYNILIDSLCKNKKVEDALSLLDDMKGKGVNPNTTTFNAIFKGLEETKELDKALALMDQMTEQACNPDYITMEVLTNWLSAVGETEKLKSFVQGYPVSAHKN